MARLIEPYFNVNAYLTKFIFIYTPIHTFVCSIYIQKQKKIAQ